MISRASRKEERSEVGGAVLRHGVVVRAVGVHDADLEAPGRVRVPREVLPVTLEVFGRGRMVGPVDDLLPVVREERAAVVAGRVRETADSRAVGVHRVDLEVAVSRRREDDRLPVGRDRRLRVVGGRGEERLRAGAVGVRGVDVVVVERPDVAAGAIGPRRARRAGADSRGVEDALAVGEEVRAGRLALAVGDPPAAGPVGGHREDLVAREGAFVGLEDQPPAVGRPVRLGVLSAEGQLADVREELLLSGREQRPGCRRRASAAERSRPRAR